MGDRRRLPSVLHTISVLFLAPAPVHGHASCGAADVSKGMVARGTVPVSELEASSSQLFHVVALTAVTVTQASVVNFGLILQGILFM